MSLAGIGALAGGLSQGLAPYFQQLMQNPGSSDLGAALMSIYGGGQQGQGGQQQGMGSLMVPQAAQQAQAPQQPPQAPPMQAPQAPLQVPNQPPTGQARAPLAAPPSQQTAQAQPTPPQLPPKAPPPMPMTAQPGTGVGAGNTPLPTPTPPQGGGTAALATQQQQAPPLPQPQQRGPAPQRGQGTFDFDRLAGALATTPGMTPQKMGRIVTSPAFARLLNVQGLQQYRALQGQLGRERVQQGYERLGQGEERIGETARHNKVSEGFRGQFNAWNDRYKIGQGEITAIRDAARGQRSSVNAQLFSGTMKQEDAQKQLAIIDEEEARKVEAAQKKIGEPPEAPQEGGGEHQAGETYIAQDGTRYTFKGGDWNDKNNFTPAQ